MADSRTTDKETGMVTANEVLMKAYKSRFNEALPPNSENCSGFLKSLGQEMGFYVPNLRADGILAYLEMMTVNNNYVSLWQKLGVGKEGLSKAISYAQQGRLIIAATNSVDYGQSEGHVAVVLSKRIGPHNAPLIFGGSTIAGPRSPGTKTIRMVWNMRKLHVIHFFMHRTIYLGLYE
ncbi:hypothetical protein G8759_10885 [Spirosoma aureum]|uniref:Uncharacterized protein n=1 Tax=Spirosoma aureum TaxID=2692134 RepID=A0A6G9AL79_9BACT|nr:hypothetical protein [Spirosoma aureum]QIP13094.1 hypothetical protein G8759_10885 [Spirosoma aureum]